MYFLTKYKFILIIIASIRLYNYIKKKFQQDMVFTEFDQHPNFLHEDILTDVVPCPQTHSS